MGVYEEPKHYFNILCGAIVSLVHFVVRSPFSYIFHHVLLDVPLLAAHYCPLQRISLLFSSLHMPIFCVSFSFLFLDHLPHIPVPMFALSFAFSFPFTAVNRQTILPLQKAVSLASFLAWSCHLQSLTCCLGRSFCFFQHDMQRTCTFCKHVHSHAKAFLSSFQFMFH